MEVSAKQALRFSSVSLSARAVEHVSEQPQACWWPRAGAPMAGAESGGLQSAPVSRGSRAPVVTSSRDYDV